MAGQLINPQSFPPGSSQAFIDLIVRLGKLLDTTSGTAEDASQTAEQAQQTADGAKSVNDTQNQTLNDHQQEIQAQGGDIDALADVINQDVIRNDRAQLQIMAGPLSVGTELRISNVKVLGGRITGWTATTGTQKKGGMDADQALPVGAAYSQAEVKAISDALVEIRQIVAALQAAAMSHGWIGA